MPGNATMTMSLKSLSVKIDESLVGYIFSNIIYQLPFILTSVLHVAW